MAGRIASPSPAARKQSECHPPVAVPVFRRLFVALDDLAPEQGAFAQSLAWAIRLRLPMFGIIGSADERVSLCASACDRSGVPFESIGRRESNTMNVPHVAGSGDLRAFGHSLPAEQKRKLVHTALGEASPAILLCPNSGEPLNRILLLDQGCHGLQSSLRVAVEICCAFRAKLIVLTVARSTKEAQRRQHALRDALAGYNLDAEFDLMMGSEVRAAVVRVAYWRRCQLVIMARPVGRSWWRWLRDPAPDWFLNLVEPLCFLSVPERRNDSTSPLLAKVDVNVDR